jgi:hypothetical protein
LNKKLKDSFEYTNRRKNIETAWGINLKKAETEEDLVKGGGGLIAHSMK